ncbi:unnamed protein product [Diabrotica balteata]|uniref:BESS domain-containing protein n=1 Tax=Diabrotica balteata TaxID=107213 RepID=A0A9N9TCD9_DIABA|nr:unnamed protein product [Diabrotica balteata]
MTLYDFKSEDYKNRVKKLNAWTNVCQRLYGNGWDDLEVEAKRKIEFRIMSPPRRKCHFNAELQKDYPFMKVKSVSSASNHQHTLAANAEIRSNKLPSFFKYASVSSENLIIAAKEGTFAYHTIRHMHSFRSLDCTSKLISNLFESKFCSARTKSEAIVKNILARESQLRLEVDMQKANFLSIILHSSNHKDTKLVPLLVTYFDSKTGIQTKLLQLVDLPGKEVQRRWKSLKDAYQRALKARETKSGDGASKKRPYIYEKQMEFLSTTMKSRRTTGTMNNESAKVDGNVNTEEERVIIEDDTSTNDIGNIVIKKTPHKKRKRTDDFDSQLLEILRNSSSAAASSNPTVAPQDKDKMFLLSLLPYVKKMTEFDKIPTPEKVKTITRRELYDILREFKGNKIDEKFTLLEDRLAQMTSCPREDRNILSRSLKYFKASFKQKWAAARNTDERFLKHNEEWLKTSLELLSWSSLKPGRPVKQFHELSERSKRRRTEEIRACVPVEELTFAARVSQGTSGNKHASKMIKEITSTPTKAKKIRKIISSKKDHVEMKYTPQEALSLFVEAYKEPIKKWQIRTPEDKNIIKETKEKIQKCFRAEMDLLVHIPKAGYGNSNDGNTSRRFFQNTECSSCITGINRELINRFKVILEVISSGHEIDHHKFENYAQDTAKLYVKLYGWHPMSPTVHKMLIHGAQVIEQAILPIGQLSEEVAEARNKHFRKYRVDFSRKFSRIDCNRDVLNRLLLTSDPLISCSRSKNKQKILPFSDEAKAILITATPNPNSLDDNTVEDDDDEEDSDIIVESDCTDSE